MKHIVSINEEWSKPKFITPERQKEIIQCYYDSFIELSDLNAFVSVVIAKTGMEKMINIKNIDRAMDAVDKSWDKNDCTSMSFEIRGYVETHDSDDSYRNSEDTLREIYAYVSEHLKGDEEQFAGMSGTSIKNISTHIRVEVPSGEVRDVNHPSIVSHGYTHNTNGDRIMIDYSINPTSEKQYGLNLVKRYQSYKNRNVYQFPTINADDRIKLISIVHKVTI
jgi:hypothetical protein